MNFLETYTQDTDAIGATVPVNPDDINDENKIPGMLSIGNWYDEEYICG